LVAVLVVARSNAGEAFPLANQLAGFVEQGHLGLVAMCVECLANAGNAVLVRRRPVRVVEQGPRHQMSPLIVAVFLPRAARLISRRPAVAQHVALLDIQAGVRAHEFDTLGVASVDPSIIAITIEKYRLDPRPGLARGLLVL